MPFPLGGGSWITRNGDYRRVYDSGRKKAGRYLVCFCLKSAGGSGTDSTSYDCTSAGCDDRPAFRVGITVSGKVGMAHERNRVKRRLREALRSEVIEFEYEADIVFVARNTVKNAGYEELCRDVRGLLSWCKS